VFAQPDHMSGKLVDKFGRGAGISEKIAACDVGLALQGQSDRVAGKCAIERAVKGEDLSYLGAAARAGDQHFLARRDRARGNGPAIATEFAIGPVYPLHRKAERPVAAAAGNIHGMKMFE